MAIRELRIDDDPILRKKCREITEVTDRIKVLAEDLIDTMYENNGVGLAAPQVGVLRRIFVVDVGDGPVVMINPEISNEEGTQCGEEGCLSLPNQSGVVERPYKLVAKFRNLDWELCEMECEELMARATCHELDHLNGILFTDRAIDEEEA